MTPRDAFDAWAPPQVPWSAWAKPTLFVDRASPPSRMGLPPASTVPVTLHPDAAFSAPASEDLIWPLHIPKHCALVLDLPGPRAVEAGVALIDRGYWPVPLFNATPGPSPVVDVSPTVRALFGAAPALRAAGSRASDAALPCFLIDDNRCPRVSGSMVNRYDNRSIVFPQDFPSATLLRSRGLEQVLVVHHTFQNGSHPQG
jgi:hypothetical protein